MSEEIPRVGPGDGRGLPEHLRADFEKLDGDSASTQIARARIAPMLLFLFRVDPGWTRRVMLSRMNLQNPDRFDHHLWEAYLWSPRSEEHTSELQSLMRISYAVFCLKKKNNKT